MNAAPLAFTIVGGLLLAVLPRRSAVLPLVLAVLYTTRAPILELGPANLSVLRVLVVVGILRIATRGERLANGVNAVDRFVVSWAVLLVGTSVFHTTDAWTYRIGLVWGELGVYFLCRVFVRNADDAQRLFRVICVALAPLAILMLLEKYTAHNYFTIMGTAGPISIRQGHVRACGPFAHAILAGSVGAMCVPMALCLWKRHRVCSLIGLVSAAGIVFASTSSGPVMMLLFSCVALLLWEARRSLSIIRWGAVATIVALQLVMKDPVYFLMARIDITGGSTGWHRAQLIRASIESLDEWWAAGTDYTRHWMPTGIQANEIHADLTNHFLQVGVWGGLPLLFLFLLMLLTAFRLVGRALRQSEDVSPQRSFLAWTLGAMLFGYVVNFWSSSPFDQSISMMYIVLAMIGAVQVPLAVARASPSAGERNWTRRPQPLRACEAAAWAHAAPRQFKPGANAARWTARQARYRGGRGGRG